MNSEPCFDPNVSATHNAVITGDTYPTARAGVCYGGGGGGGGGGHQ